MKIKLYRSATVGLNFKNFKILTDPWLTDGEHLGSWFHYPKFDFDSNKDELNSYDAIYVSHIHPDHCSSDTLKLIDKKIPIFIHSFHRKFLKGKLESLGFKVNELKNGELFRFNKDLNLRVYAADNCDPELCYKFSGCADLTAKEGSQQIDTLSVFEYKNKVVVNVNDCPFDLAKSTFNEIKKNYKKIDVLLTGYCGAGPYPQCFENLNSEEKKQEGFKKEKFFLDQAIKFVDELKPSYILPFAGTYTLAGKLSNLNHLRGNPSIDQAYDFFDDFFSKNENYKFVKTMRLNPGQSFDLNKEVSDGVYIKRDEKKYSEYINNVLSNKKLHYENNTYPKFDEILDLTKKASEKFLEKKLLNNVKLNSDIIFNIEDKYIKVDKETNEVKLIQKKELKNNYIILKIDIRLFELLLKGPRYASWNDAEGGSHLTFLRKPDVFDRGLHQLLQHFHN